MSPILQNREYISSDIEDYYNKFMEVSLEQRDEILSVRSLSKLD